jgi:NADPH:quinone reductase-like Zn-dependent oxidoreductase
VLIQVRAAGINPVDAKHVFADKLPESMAGFAQSVVNGRIPGFDFAGIVLDAPPGSGFTSGDEVFGIQGPMKGTLAERILVSCAQVAYKPVGISFIEATCAIHASDGRREPFI